MKKNRRYTDQELARYSHYLVADGLEYWICRYEVVFSDKGDRKPLYVILEIKSKNGSTKTLRFNRPDFKAGLPADTHDNDLGPVYVMDMYSFGYEDTDSLEVGSVNNDAHPYFWAESVEEIS